MAQLKDLLVLGPSRFLGNIYGTLKGNADTATKLANARKLKTNLESTTDVQFDGSTDQTSIPVTGTLGVANGGTGNTSLTAKRLVWTESGTKMTAANHYANSTKVAINSMTEPTENFYVNGTSFFKDTVTFNNQISLKSDTSSAFNTVGIMFGTNNACIGASTAGNLGLYAANQIFIRPSSGSSSKSDAGFIVQETQIVPGATKIINFGSSEAEWKDTYTHNLKITGYENKFLTGTGTAHQADSTNNQYRAVSWTFNTDIALAEGNEITIKTPIAGHSNGVYLSVDNGATYKPVTVSGTARLTTHYPAGSYITLVYNPSGSAASMYPRTTASTTATSTVTGGVWVVKNYYDSGNSNTAPTVQCETAAATAAKVGTCTNYSLLAKSYTIVNLRYSNTSATALTLNVNSKGAKPIYINGTASSSTNYTLPAGSYLVYYDGTNYYFRTDGKITGSITGDADTLDGTHLNAIAAAKSTTLSWNTETTIATIGGNNIKIKIPANPNTWRPVETTLTNQDLNDVTTAGFYNAGGGNSVTNKPSGVDHFGMTVIHRAAGAYYTQILQIQNKTYRRYCDNGTWTAWAEDKYTDANTTYGTVSKIAAGLAPQLPDETTTTKYLRQDGTWAVPPDNNTDTKVTQNVTTSGGWRKILLHCQVDSTANADVTNGTDKVYAALDISVKPTTGTIRAKEVLTEGTGFKNDITETSNSSGLILTTNAKQVARLYASAIGTAGDGTTNGTQGTVYLMLGNGTARDTAEKSAGAADGTKNGANNSRGILRIYNTDTTYTDINATSITGHSMTLIGSTSTTANTAAYSDFTLGNSANISTTTAHSEGRLILYSAATKKHIIKGASTTTDYTHTFPKSTGWVATGGDGSSTGVGDENTPVYLSTGGVITNTGKSFANYVYKGNNDSANYIVQLTGTKDATGVIGFRVTKDNTTATKKQDIGLVIYNDNTKSGVYSYDGLKYVCYTKYDDDGTRIAGSEMKFFGAVWNDYAEYRQADTTEPGRCVVEVGNDTLVLSTERLQRGCEITSDTFGFAIGKTEKCQTPIAAAGRVLVYGYESREEFRKHIGWPVCSGPNGTVSIMTEEEEEKYPSRIIGTISAVPDYEEWGEENVKVNGRIWIRIK